MPPSMQRRLRSCAKFYSVNARSAFEVRAAFHCGPETHGWIFDARLSRYAFFQEQDAIQDQHRYPVSPRAGERCACTGPAPEALLGIRERITHKQAEWLRVCAEPKFKRQFSLGGAKLTRPPRGFAKDHPLIEDIKRKDFIAVKNLTLDHALQPKFQQQVETAFKAATPYMRFLCKAVGVPY